MLTAYRKVFTNPSRATSWFIEIVIKDEDGEDVESYLSSIPKRGPQTLDQRAEEMLNILGYRITDTWSFHDYTMDIARVTTY